MAGVYIHIPFCRSRCYYCDFYSTTAHSLQNAYLQALAQEIALRRNEWQPGAETIYFGGGTPSRIEAGAIVRLIDLIGGGKAEEITVEVNPGDAGLQYLQTLRQGGVNRLSMGVQSFHDERLKMIGRRHNSAQAIRAVETARKAGFDNLSLDLIYGLPGQTMTEWEEDIDRILALAPEHISTYCLQWEEGTKLFDMWQKGAVEPLDEEVEMAMYDRLTDQLKKAGYEHYEVSNYAKQGFRSKHNSSYWKDIPYVGLGAAAHSYDGEIRRWNPSDLDTYISQMAEASRTGVLKYDFERLGDSERYNEYIMLSLRTKEGAEANKIRNTEVAERYIAEGLLQREKERVRATQKGLHILNRIIEDLLI